MLLTNNTISQVELGRHSNICREISHSQIPEGGRHSPEKNKVLFLVNFKSWSKTEKKAVCWSGDGSASDLTTSLQLKGIIIGWKVKPVEIKKGNSNFVLVTYFSIQFFFLLSLQLTGDFASTEQAWLLRKWTDFYLLERLLLMQQQHTFIYTYISCWQICKRLTYTLIFISNIVVSIWTFITVPFYSNKACLSNIK